MPAKPSPNVNEQIEQAAKAIGRGKVRRKVFEAIYHHEAKVKTVGENQFARARCAHPSAASHGHHSAESTRVATTRAKRSRSSSSLSES